MKIGPYEVSGLIAGRFRLDGGAMFGVVPKVLWEKQCPADEKNRIQMVTRLMLIQGQGRCILVDSGLGENWTEKQKEMFVIEDDKASVDKALTTRNLTRASITDVVLTHLHFDHIGGSTVLENGKIGLRFPNAKYHTQRRGKEHAHAPTEKDRASFYSDKIEPVLKSSQLLEHDGDFSLAPGIDIRVTHGHTPGHQMVSVSSPTAGIVCTGDTLPMAAHIPLPWVMAYDLEPLKTMEEKRRLYEDAVPRNWWIFFVHDPKYAAAMVETANGRYQIGKAISEI